MSESVERKPSKEMTPEKEGDDEPSPMSPWERWTAGAIGLAATGAGTTAVFVSDNQAGTAALFVVAVAFLLIGVQGTPLTRFASGDHSADFAARRTRRKISREVIKDAVEAEKSGDSTTADSLVEVAKSIDPSVGTLPIIREREYARRLETALHRLGIKYTMDAPPGAAFIVETDDGRQLCIKTVSRSRPLGDKDYSMIKRWAKNFDRPILVVTDQEYFSGGLIDRTDVAKFVHWDGDYANNDLVHAIDRLARTAPGP
ncbi:hypothetical protein ACFYVR_25010 [Rhodococcus sp. NPDC003318]|uniref:hypothetical protein n=1 Tax=Rhodococcus sp. NPDC003318 TaxID=3364503 RepID=UPI0036B9EF5A